MEEDSLTPYKTAYRAFHKEQPLVEWSEVLIFHLHCENAWVVKTPTAFVIARQVCSSWTDEQILHLKYSSDQGDALHVYVAAGDLSELMGLIPPALKESLKTLTFQRRGARLHRVPLSIFPKSALS